jgi:hypothetical protein
VVSDRARRLILILWIPALLAGGIMTIEILLQIRAAATERFRPDRTTLSKLRRAYQPFTVQHLHPFYLFFFPLQPQDRLALANAVCSVDADGFREPGPAAADGRKLAVLLGGSAAFGHYASSNDTTITSYLNRLQRDYFFVNAGVPSWNSTQELMRLSMQIADLRPALVIAYDGANDATLADIGVDANPPRQYPAGTPEHFDQLEELIDAARRPWRRITWRRLLPEIFNRIDKYTEPDAPGVPVARPIIDRAASQYINNLERMSAIAQHAGARFIAVFQPIGGLHARVTPGAFDAGSFIDDRMFRDAAMSAKPRDVALVDFSTVFDRELERVPVAEQDISADTIFVDALHLSDRGNEIIARRLWQVIAAP